MKQADRSIRNLHCAFICTNFARYS